MTLAEQGLARRASRFRAVRRFAHPCHGSAMFAAHVCFWLAPHPNTGRTPSRDLFSVALGTLRLMRNSPDRHYHRVERGASKQSADRMTSR